MPGESIYGFPSAFLDRWSRHSLARAQMWFRAEHYHLARRSETYLLAPAFVDLSWWSCRFSRFVLPFPALSNYAQTVATRNPATRTAFGSPLWLFERRKELSFAHWSAAPSLHGCQQSSYRRSRRIWQPQQARFRLLRLFGVH